LWSSRRSRAIAGSAAGASRGPGWHVGAGAVKLIALYRRSAHREVEPFNDEPYAQHWFEKRLS